MHLTEKLFSQSYTTNIEQNLHRLHQKQNFKIADRDTYIQANNRLKNKNTLEDIANFLNDLVNQNIFPNIFIFNQMMEKLFRTNHVSP